MELRRKRFDVVYQSWGALAEIGDLEGWADGIAAALKKGGILFLYDEHPVAACLDQMLHWHESYFETWPIGRLVHSLGGAGDSIQDLHHRPAVGLCLVDRPREKRPGQCPLCRIALCCHSAELLRMLMIERDVEPRRSIASGHQSKR